MKLLHIPSGEVVVWSHTELPPYAILPYPYTQNQGTGNDQKLSKWAKDTDSGKKIPISNEITRACEKALSKGIQYLWEKSLCVDPTSLIEEEKAANNSFERLRGSSVCIIFLDDLPAGTPVHDENAWARCRYWERGSAPQELVIAPHVEFYDQKWNYICSKSSEEYLGILSKVSKLPRGVLANSNKLNISSIARSSRAPGQVASHLHQPIPSFTQTQPPQYTFSPRSLHHIQVDAPRNLGQPIQAASQNKSSMQSPPVYSMGTKRDRSGQPLNGHSRCNSRIFSFQSDLNHDDEYDDSSTCDESDSESDSSSSELDSESEISSEDEDWQLRNARADEICRKANDEFQSMRTELIDFAYEKTKAWMSTARYVPPPDDRLPPRKRARTTDRQPQSTLYFKKIDKEDPNTVIVSRVDGYFHFACPYYVSNPTKHQQCLRKHDLQSVEDVIQHMGQNHREPPYCPRCCRIFEGARERDKHFLARVCENSSSRDVEGITERQKIKMEKRHDFYMGERKRWLRVWSIAFPNVEFESPKTPYLEKLQEARVGMARDYWARNAKDVILEFVSNNPQVRRDRLEDGMALKLVERLVLLDIIDRIMCT